MVLYNLRDRVKIFYHKVSIRKVNWQNYCPHHPHPKKKKKPKEKEEEEDR